MTFGSDHLVIAFNLGACSLTHFERGDIADSVREETKRRLERKDLARLRQQLLDATKTTGCMPVRIKLGEDVEPAIYGTADNILGLRLKKESEPGELMVREYGRMATSLFRRISAEEEVDDLVAAAIETFDPHVSAAHINLGNLDWRAAEAAREKALAATAGVLDGSTDILQLQPVRCYDDDRALDLRRVA